jgi:hypothetical protein
MASAFFLGWSDRKPERYTAAYGFPHRNKISVLEMVHRKRLNFQAYLVSLAILLVVRVILSPIIHACSCAIIAVSRVLLYNSAYLIYSSIAVMPHSVQLSDQLYEEARRCAGLNSRSVPKQIEYWSRIGKIAEENPDLPYEFIKSLLISKAEVDAGDVIPFQFE